MSMVMSAQTSLGAMEFFEYSGSDESDDSDNEEGECDFFHIAY